MLHLRKAWLLSLLVLASAFAAEKRSTQQLTDLANSHSPALQEAITASFDAKDLKEGTAWSGHGPDFFFAIETTSQPSLFVDGAPGAVMEHLNGSDLWYA